MGNFNKAFQFTIGEEGGYSNDADDPGGPTNWGITQEDLAGWRGKPVTADDVRNMKIDEARQIYEAQYWNPISCDKINSDMIATALFDQGVNRGVVTAAIDLQQVVKTIPDGKIGPISLALINASDPKKLLGAFCDLSEAHYRTIAANNRRLRKFLPGWLNRIATVRALGEAE